jgi:hypothetical protein
MGAAMDQGLYFVARLNGEPSRLDTHPFPEVLPQDRFVLQGLLAQAQRHLQGAETGAYGTYGSGSRVMGADDLPIGVYYRAGARSSDSLYRGEPLTLLSGSNIGNVGANDTPIVLGMVRYALEQVD